VTFVSLLRPEVLDLSIYSAHCQHSPVHALVPDVMVKAGPQVELAPSGGKRITQLGAVLGALGEMTERLSAILEATAVLDRLRYRCPGLLIMFANFAGIGRAHARCKPRVGGLTMSKNQTTQATPLPSDLGHWFRMRDFYLANEKSTASSIML
jgi:hypothetical protein